MKEETLKYMKNLNRTVKESFTDDPKTNTKVIDLRPFYP